MGQKVNPIGYRLAVNQDWRSKWYAPEEEFADFLHGDLKIRNYLKEKLMFAAVSKIFIERAWNSLRVTLFTARPGLVMRVHLLGSVYVTHVLSARKERQRKNDRCN